MADDWVLHKQLVLHLLKELQSEIQQLKENTKTLNNDVQQLKIVENRLQDLIKIAKEIELIQQDLNIVEKTVLILRTRWAVIGIFFGTVFTAAVNYAFRILG